MTAATLATPPTAFEIKSANLPLVALLLKSTDLDLLTHELAQRFGDEPDFFDQDALLIDLSPLQPQSAAYALDFPALITLLGRYQLVPVAIKGGSPPQMMAALQAGLLPVPDAHLVSGQPKAAPPSHAAPAAKKAGPVERPVQAQVPSPPPSHSATAAPASPPPSPGALVIDKPLRSGQQVYARGRDLVVLAMVNAGAEVIADGHIHVYAPLRGKAMAGARGNTDARIFALELNAELLSIAGVYRTSEFPLPAQVQGKPTQVRLVATTEGDKLVFDAMQ